MPRTRETRVVCGNIVVERAGGATFVGPRLDEAICEACYLARRSANQHWPPSFEPIDDLEIATGLSYLERIPREIACTIEVQSSGQIRRHFVVPLPLCSRCIPTPPGYLTLQDSISDRTGLVKGVSVQRLEGHVDLFLARVEGCDTSISAGLSALTVGLGCGNVDQAIAAAIGESLERYAVAHMPSGLSFGRETDQQLPTLQPESRFFAGSEIGLNTRLQWIEGSFLADGSPCMIPAAAVYFPYVCHDEEPNRSTGGSEGLAAGPTVEFALRHATHEVLERDAFMRSWRFGAKARSIGNDGSLRLLVVPSRFGLPVVAGFSESSEPPFCAAGLAGRETIEEALDAAQRESLAARVLSYEMLKAGELYGPQSRYVHSTDRSLRKVRDSWVGPEPIVATEVKSVSWCELTSRLRQAAFVNVTPPDVAAFGVSVIRSVIPGTIGFDPTPNFRSCGGNFNPIPY